MVFLVIYKTTGYFTALESLLYMYCKETFRTLIFQLIPNQQTTSVKTRILWFLFEKIKQFIYRILTSSCQFPFEEEEIERPGEETVVNFVAASSADVRSTLALTGDDVAVVVISAAGVAVARFAAVRVYERKNRIIF